MRDDPTPDEDVTLQLTVADDAETEGVERAIAETVSAQGGAVVGSLPFDTVVVTLPQTALSAVCDLDGIEQIETGETLGITPGDAGEDLDSLPE